MEFKYERIKNKKEINDVCEPFLKTISEIFERAEKKPSLSITLSRFTSEAITSLFNIEKDFFNAYEVSFELLRYYFLMKLREDYSVKSTKINVFRSVLIEKKFPYMKQVYDMGYDSLVDNIIDFYKKTEEPKKTKTIEEIEDIINEDSDEDIEIKEAFQEIEEKRIIPVEKSSVSHPISKNRTKEVPDHVNDLEEYYLSPDETNIDAQTEKDKTVICPICGDRMKQITPQHLNKRHGITTAEFREIFPNVIMRYNSNPGKRSKQAEKILATQHPNLSSKKPLTNSKLKEVNKEKNSAVPTEQTIKIETPVIEKVIEKSIESPKKETLYSGNNTYVENEIIENSLAKESVDNIVEELFAYKVITTLMEANERHPDLIKDACKEIYKEASKGK